MAVSRLILLATFWLICWPRTLFSSSCPTIEHNIHLQNESFNQGTTGWCYAFAAAALVSHQLDRSISPVAIASDFYQDKGLRTLPNRLVNFKKSLTEKGGKTDVAIKIGLEKGFCPIEQMPTELEITLKKNKRRYPLRIEEYIKFIESFELLYTEKTNISFRTLLECMPIFDKTNVVSQVIGKLDKDSAINIRDLANAVTASSQDFVANYIELKCTKRVKPTRPFVVTKEDFLLIDKQDYRKNLVLSKLNEGPVAVSTTSKLIDVPPGRGMANHVFVIVGQRWNQVKNRCMLIAKDSSFGENEIDPNDLVRDADNIIYLSPKK